MATDVKLPRLGQGMESGVIVRWLKSAGEPVGKGDPLYELDTDKVTQEVEAEADGVLLEILVPEGEVEVGTVVARIGTDGDGASRDLSPETTRADEPEESPKPSPEQPTTATGAEATDAPSAAHPVETTIADPAAPATSPPASAQSAAGRMKASPLARRIARERGVDLATVVATGPEGRILAEDVERASGAAGQAGAAPPGLSPVSDVAEFEVVPLTSIRKTIARRLSEAWSAPVFQLGVSADMGEMLALRGSLVAALREGDTKPTVNDVLIRLVAVALTRHTAVNATFTGEEIHRHASANVGIAVAAPQGLVVPVIAGAERLNVQEIARDRADLVGRARDNKLKLTDLEGGTFTISNLGMFGVEQFTAVLNPPQVAILAVGAVTDEVVVVEGELEIAPIMRMTLTCDHRAIDGADGARFLQTLVALVEQPALAL